MQEEAALSERGRGSKGEGQVGRGSRVGTALPQSHAQHLIERHPAAWCLLERGGAAVGLELLHF